MAGTLPRLAVYRTALVAAFVLTRLGGSKALNAVVTGKEMLERFATARAEDGSWSWIRRRVESDGLAPRGASCERARGGVAADDDDEFAF